MSSYRNTHFSAWLGGTVWPERLIGAPEPEFLEEKVELVYGSVAGLARDIIRPMQLKVVRPQTDRSESIGRGGRDVKTIVVQEK